MIPECDEPTALEPLRWWQKIEEYLLAALLMMMMVLVCLQIILRSVFSGGLVWADSLIRYLVLWSGMLGAALATARGKHISIDFAAHFFPEGIRPYLQIVVHLFASLAAAGLCYASWLFIRTEYTYGSAGPFGYPNWAWNLIFPLTFCLIFLRYLAKLCADLRGLCQSARPENHLS